MLVKPLLKWAGGKRRQAAMLRALFDDLLFEEGAMHFKGYIEPFFGSGAVAATVPLHIAAAYGPVVLNDASEPLIRFWRAVRTGGVWEAVCGLPWGVPRPEDYARIRDELRNPPAGMTDADIAARFYWINRHGYNGLWRVNRKGKCNVPMGGYARVDMASLPMWRQWQQILTIPFVDLTCGDFETAVPSTGPLTHCVIYCDPPYAGTFDGYTPEGFSTVDQHRLIDVGASWARRGAIVVVSNSDDPDLKARYLDRGYAFETLRETRSVSADGTCRGSVTEHVYYLTPSMLEAP